MSVPQPNGASPAMNMQQPSSAAPPPGSNASLYVGDLDEEVDERMIFEKFNQVGSILSIRVCRDMITKKSLGYAYVNFSNPQDAEKAIDTLNFDTLRDRQMRIMWSQRDPSLRRSGVGNLFIKNLDKTVTTRELYDTFSLIGQILSCKIATDEKGMSRGYGFIHFSSSECADRAIERLNDKVVKGKKIYVAHFQPKSQRSTKTMIFNNVYIKNFGEDMDEDKLRGIFGKFGDITSVKVEKSPDGKSRGFGFVCYKEPRGAMLAVDEMNGKDYEGKVLFVGRAMKKSERSDMLKQEYEKKKTIKTTKFNAGVNLYVKNLDDNMDDDALKTEFSKVGKVTSVRVMRDTTGRSKGFGFVCFSRPEDATKAVTDLNGTMVNNKPIYVALAQRKDERRAILATQYMQRQFALRSQMPNPISGPGMPGPGFMGITPTAAQMAQHPGMNFMMNMNFPGGQGNPGFFPGGPGPMRNMYPGQQPQMGGPGGGPGGMPFGAMRQQPNRWMTPSGGGMQGMQGMGGMRPQVGVPQGNNQVRPMAPVPTQGQVRQQAPAGMRPTTGAVGGNQPGAVQYTANVRNLQQPRAPMAPNNANVAGGGDEAEASQLSAIASMKPEDQKQALGEKIYNIVKDWYPKQVGKLTGMILEVDCRELITMVAEYYTDPTKAHSTLRDRVDNAYNALVESNKAGDAK